MFIAQGFRSQELARGVVISMARGFNSPCWLTKDKRGWYYFVRVPVLPAMQKVAEQALNYTGVTIVERYDETGRKVEEKVT